ncbi:hypothetical protein NKG60_00140 [Mesorhizobium sp. M1428]
MPLRKERAGRVRAVGVAFVEIADEGERQAIDNATGMAAEKWRAGRR